MTELYFHDRFVAVPESQRTLPQNGRRRGQRTGVDEKVIHVRDKFERNGCQARHLKFTRKLVVKIYVVVQIVKQADDRDVLERGQADHAFFQQKADIGRRGGCVQCANSTFARGLRTFAFGTADQTRKDQQQES